jgi:ATP-dependent Clp protease ATP-binding subunit ClpC
MFERFSESSTKVILNAQTEAARLEQPHVDSEHLLLGMLDGGAKCKATAALQIAGLTLEETRAEVEKMVGKGPGAKDVAPFSPLVEQIIQAACAEATNLGFEHIYPEHLLLALLQIPNCTACTILQNHDVSLTKLHQALVNTLPPSRTR